MEDVKWLLRRCGIPILLLLIFVIVGVICWGELHTEEQKVAEEVWESPVEIENSEAATEEAEDAETFTESAYWFIPQASDCLISDEEKEQLQSMVLSAEDSVGEIYKDIVIADAPSYSSGISEFTNEQRKAVVEQLREHCRYNADQNSYEYEMIYASPYPPFGEVVDYKENTDGTITLIVDGVWPDYNSALAFRNEIVVQPFADGTYRYLSNSIEQIELELPPIARKKG